MPGYLEIGICFGLILICSALSRFKMQGLEKDLLIGSIRALIQLSLLGYLLTWIFKNQSAYVVLIIAIVMTLNSALETNNRIKIRHNGLFLDNLLATVLAIWPLVFLGSALLHSVPIWKVETLLPLLGMLLGNTLNGISIGVDFFGTELKSNREEVLSLVALGASPKEATSQVTLRALKIAMTPTLNAMASMGLVSIPGMMTGQILAGSSPSEAAITQTILMLLIAVGTYLATYLGLTLARRHKFNRQGIPCFE